MSFISYLLEVTVCLGLFYCFFTLLLEKDTTFRINRFYLLSTLVLGLIIPALNIQIEPKSDPTLMAVPSFYISNLVSSVSLDLTDARNENSFPWKLLLMISYSTGCLFMTIKFIIEIIKINKLKKRGLRTEINGINCIKSEEIRSPFTFFSTIFMPSGYEYSTNEISGIIRHEKAHIENRHTWDVIFVELILIFFWMIPFIYLYRRKMRELHEYMADAEVVRFIQWEQYAQLLISQKFINAHSRLANPLAYSHIKKRLRMMNRNRSLAIGRIKYLGLLPVISLTIVLFSIRETSLIGQKTIYDLYEDGLRVYTILDDPFSVDTLPLTVVTASREISPDSDRDTVPIISQSTSKNSESSSDEIFTYVEEMPRFPGCEHLSGDERSKCGATAMYEFIYNKIRYPEYERDNGIAGIVIAQFVVEPDGSLSNIRILRSPSEGLADEAYKIISAMNDMPLKWIPGRQDGRFVAVQFTLPIKFILEQQNNNEPGAKDIERNGESPHDEVFTVAEEMPRFPGCESLPEKDRFKCSNDALFKFIYETVKYPNEDRQNGNEGMVIAQFVVGTDGSILNPRIVRGISPGLNAEVLRVINKMNELPEKWKPGRNNGITVPVMFTVPFKFALEADRNGKFKPGELPDLWRETQPAENEWIKIKPNPTEDFVEIEILETGSSIQIFDAARKMEMWKKERVDPNESKFKIDVSQWPSGKYVILQVKDGNHKTSGFMVID